MFEAESLTETEAHWIGQTDWIASSGDLPVPALLELLLQTCAAVPSFLRSC